MTDTAARHLRLLSDVVFAATASLELDEVLGRVAESVAGALDADACFVYVLDEDRDELVLGASVGVRPDPGRPAPRLRLGEGVTGHAAELAEPVVIERAAHLDPRFRSLAGLDEEAYESMLAVPILARERLVGALNIRTVAPRSYDAGEVELLATIAASVGQSIENARLWGRSQRRLAELEALDRIARAVLSPADLDEALRDVVVTAAEAVGADVCALALVAAAGEPATLAVRSSPDGPDDEALLRAAAAAPLEEPGLIALPLETRRAPLGALVAARRGGRFTRAERALLGSVAAQATAAVARARGAMRGLLAQEIHHRVKNNLQTVASLLRLAAAGDGDPRLALRDSVGRVLSIAEVHDALTRGRADDIDAAGLLQRLSDMLRRTHGERPVSTVLAPVVLGPARATALALVFCELFANAVEHGAGPVEVVLRRDGAFAELRVLDEGPGLEAGAPRGQGLAIAGALVEADLEGTLDVEGDGGGTRAVVRFPLEVAA
jgi:two-component sensor histidine kinase/putative methionine-R-sulfoxide reductase with GAF domain